MSQNNSIICVFEAIPWNKSTKVALESNFEKLKYHHVAFLAGLQKSPYPMLGALDDEIAREGLCED